MKRLAFALLATAFSAASAHAADAPLSKADVEGIVKQFIMDNPEVILDSFKNYQAKKSADQQKNAGKLIAENRKELMDGGSPVLGNPKGNVTIVEFFDAHCGYCKKMLPVLTQLVKDDPNVRVVLKDFPILSEDSRLAGKASVAFYKLNPKNYQAFHTDLLAFSGQYTEAALLEMGKKHGVDSEKFKKEIESKATDEQLTRNQKLASTLGIGGTPAFIIGDELIPGATSLEDLKKRIEEERKKGKK